MHLRHAWIPAWTLSLAALCAWAGAEYQFDFQEPASAIAREQHSLHIVVLWIITGIAVVVFGAMFYSIVHHRKSSGREAAHFHHNTLVEIIWTAVPMVIIVAMAVPATRVLLEVRDTSSPELSVKVTGSQWRWHYDYLDQDIRFFSSLSTPTEAIGGLFYSSFGDGAAAPKGENYLLEVDNEMVVPVGRKVRVLLTAADVLHAWWVPQLGVKQDAIPGFVRETWFRADRPGVYRGQCAELCGKNHAYMPIVVRAVPEAEFAAWVRESGGRMPGDEPEEAPALAQAAQPSAPEAPPGPMTAEELMAAGEAAYGSHCVACHQLNGQGLPPAFPALAGGPITTGPKGPHIDIVLNGKAGTAMAAFSYLSDADIAAIITYERNSWGNATGDTVTAEEVAAAR